MKAKANRLNLRYGHQLTPNILENSPYKLHVSLGCEAYLKHKEKIIDLIVSHLVDGAINEFKFVQQETVTSTIASKQQLLESVLKYAAMLEKDEQPDVQFKDKLINDILNHFGGFKRLPSPNEIKDIINKLNSEIKECQRFFDTDQITIYIPQDFDKDKISTLCKEINSYLTKNDAVPGKIVDVESPLGKYINFRQEYLMEDFHSINRAGSMDDSLRIDSVTPGNHENEAERRRLVVIEQNTSDLYRYISEHVH
jgi:hypothetical protein